MEYHSSDVPTARVCFSIVTELLFAAQLASGGPPSVAGFDEEWRAVQLAQLPDRARAYLERMKGLASPVLSIVDYATKYGELDDLAAFLARIAAEPVEEFLYVVLNEDLDRTEIAESVRDPASAAHLTGRLSYFSLMGEADLVGIFRDPEGFRDDFLFFIGANRTPAFAAKVESLRARYEERIAAVEERLKRRHPMDVAEEFKKRAFDRRDYRDYVFVPSYFIGRLNITSAVGDSFLFAFNIDPEGSGDNREGAAVAASLRVIADRSRLEILRLLSSGPSYGKELASRLGLTTATVSRHLDQLKAEGLVAEDKADAQNVKLVRINAEAVRLILARADSFVCGSGACNPHRRRG